MRRRGRNHTLTKRRHIDDIQNKHKDTDTQADRRADGQMDLHTHSHSLTPVASSAAPCCCDILVQLTSFEKDVISSDPKVIAFYHSLGCRYVDPKDSEGDEGDGDADSMGSKFRVAPDGVTVLLDDDPTDDGSKAMDGAKEDDDEEDEEDEEKKKEEPKAKEEEKKDKDGEEANGTGAGSDAVTKREIEPKEEEWEEEGAVDLAELVADASRTATSPSPPLPPSRASANDMGTVKALLQEAARTYLSCNHTKVCLFVCLFVCVCEERCRERERRHTHSLTPSLTHARIHAHRLRSRSWRWRRRLSEKRKCPSRSKQHHNLQCPVIVSCVVFV